jgi:hypothetical protein
MVAPAHGCDGPVMANESGSPPGSGEGELLTRDSLARRWNPMTVTATSERRDRSRLAAAAHVYVTPVVRELPSQPVEIFDSRLW